MELNEAFDACHLHVGRGADAAVVLVDAPVTDGPPGEAFLERFEAARRTAATRGVHLVDWFDCDDDRFRTSRLTTMDLAEQPDWWDVPAWRGSDRT